MMYHNIDWESELFSESDSAELGQRLGINYLRTLQESVDIKLNSTVFSVTQSSMGLMAISNVVWDCGLYLVDVLADDNSNKTIGALGCVLELGCGTGLVGIASLILGADKVIFSDVSSAHCWEDNLETLSTELKVKCSYVAHDWNEPIVPDTMTQPMWDTVLCSDVLYEEKNHAPLLALLHKLHFGKIVFAYKKRHDAAERLFFTELAKWCALKVVNSDIITLRNISKGALSGLYVVVATPLTQN